VAAANLAALEASLDSSFTAVNVGTGIGVDVVEIAQRIASETRAYLARKQSPITIPDCQHGPARSGDLRSNLISPELAERLLHWRPTVQLADGIRETVGWFGERNEG
jgi:UDP-glucose 4-epimerase